MDYISLFNLFQAEYFPISISYKIRKAVIRHIHLKFLNKFTKIIHD